MTDRVRQLSALAQAQVSSFIDEVLLGSQLDTKRRAGMLAPDELRERDQQFHVAISGQAGTIAAYSSFHVNFDVEFIGPAMGRNSDLNWPTFTSGYVLTSPNPVAVVAMVLAWDFADGYKTTGATVAWGAWAPDSPSDPLDFLGSLHLNFQGYGSPPEIDSSEAGDTLGTLSTAPAPVG